MYIYAFVYSLQLITVATGSQVGARATGVEGSNHTLRLDICMRFTSPRVVMFIAVIYQF